MSDPLNALREQLQQLEARHGRGELAQEAYAAQRAALERAILDRVIAKPVPAGAAPAEARRPSTRLVAGVAAVVLAIAAGGYAWTGSPQLLDGVPAAALPSGDEMQQFTASVERLSARLASEPDNAEGWAVLARAYVYLERFADSLPAFVKAVELNPGDARLLADYADAMAVTRDRKLEEAMKALEKGGKGSKDKEGGKDNFKGKNYGNLCRFNMCLRPCLDNETECCCNYGSEKDYGPYLIIRWCLVALDQRKCSGQYGYCKELHDCHRIDISARTPLTKCNNVAGKGNCA
jgi:cytochrome c-type biogenesis protein CcmI